jgi:hypothetical protein
MGRVGWRCFFEWKGFEFGRLGF